MEAGIERILHGLGIIDLRTSSGNILNADMERTDSEKSIQKLLTLKSRGRKYDGFVGQIQRINQDFEVYFKHQSAHFQLKAPYVLSLPSVTTSKL